MNQAIKQNVISQIGTLSFMCDSSIINTGKIRRAIMTTTKRYDNSHNVYGRSKGVEPIYHGEVNSQLAEMILEHSQSDSNRFGKE